MPPCAPCQWLVRLPRDRALAHAARLSQTGTVPLPRERRGQRKHHPDVRELHHRIMARGLNFTPFGAARPLGVHVVPGTRSRTSSTRSPCESRRASSFPAYVSCTIMECSRVDFPVPDAPTGVGNHGPGSRSAGLPTQRIALFRCLRLMVQIIMWARLGGASRDRSWPVCTASAEELPWAN
jgi:hypothetical protein